MIKFKIYYACIIYLLDFMEIIRLRGVWLSVTARVAVFNFWDKLSIRECGC